MVKFAQSYEIVRNFNNFYALVMFSLKKLQALLILVKKYDLVKIRLGQNTTWSKF